MSAVTSEIGTERTFGDWGLKSATEGKTDIAKR